MTTDLPDVRDLGLLLDQLASMGSTVRGKSCTCPNHEDKTPSASILSDAGHCRVYCHTCQQSWDVYDLRAIASGRTVGEIIKGDAPARPAPRPAPRRPAQVEDKPLILATKAEVVTYCKRMGTPTNWYTYGPKGSPALIVARIETAPGKKTFRQFTPTGGGYAAKNLREKGTLPLYREDDAAGFKLILVVEGEKSCDAAWTLGIPCVTSAMGAEKWDWSIWDTLKGKDVVLWPDNDNPGKKHMAGLGEHLAQLGCNVQRIDVDGIGLDAGGDIADLVAAWAGKPIADLAHVVGALMADAEQMGASSVLGRWQQSVYDGQWRNLDWPLAGLGRLSRATMPGCLTLVCADPGAGKSWLMLQLMRYWNESGSRCIVRMLEDDARAHLARLLAMITGEGRHTDDGWVSQNRHQVEDDMRMHRAELDRLGALIVPEGKELWEHADMVAWVERHAKAGARVIVIDPITAVKSGREPWLDDFSSAMKLKDIAYRYECSILITTHPRSSAKEPSLSAMAGGSAWSRFAHCVLWLSREKDENAASNRTMSILKSRHGKGGGMKIALNWTDACRFDELAVIQENAEPRKPRGPKVAKQPTKEEDQFK